MTGRITELEVLWHPRLKPGYGWIFPCPDGVFNIGVGVAHSRAKGDRIRATMEGVNLRDSLKAFTEVYAPARELVAGGTLGRRAEGRAAALFARRRAPFATRPARHRRSRRQHLRVHRRRHRQGARDRHPGRPRRSPKGAPSALDDATVRSRYESRVAALKPRYEVYEKANTVNAHPWLVDLLAWSARRSPRRLKRMSGVLEETHVPSSLVSVGAWMRLLFERG